MSLAKLLRSARHTRARQLVERLRRIARQRLHDAWPARSAVASRGPTPPLAPRLPRAVFAPRVERVVTPDGRPWAAFLNVTHSLATPIEWRPALAPELERMNLHYMEYLEALDDEHFARAVEEWIAAEPLARAGSWRIAWNSFVVSLRVVVWMQQVAERRERLEANFVARAVDSIAEQLRFLETHLELDIGGNHLIKNAKALLWASAFFEGPDAERWRALATELFARELDEQILSDGMHYERSPAYHAQVFADLVEAASVAAGLAAEPLRTRLTAALERMAQPLVDLTHPDGAPSLFNDGGMTMSYSPQACLEAARALGVPIPAARERFDLPAAGYFGLRSGSSYLVADCGALAPDHLPAHGHGDALAFEWSLGGKRIVVDAGVFEYERGEWRDVSRATRSHNTVTLDELDQSEFWAAFRVGRRARVRCERFEPLGAGFVLEGSHDGYEHLAGGPIHARRITVSAGHVVVDDTVRGGAGQQVRARLLFHPDVRVRRVRRGLLLQHGDVTATLDTSHSFELCHAHWCPDFGVRRATVQVVITYGAAPCTGRFSLTRVAAPLQELLEVAAALPQRESTTVLP